MAEMSEDTPQQRGADDGTERETPLDLLITAISDPKDQTPSRAGAIQDSYDVGGFGLANVGYDGQERVDAAVEGAAGSETVAQESATVATLSASARPLPGDTDQQRIADLVAQSIARRVRPDASFSGSGFDNSTMVQVWHPLAAVKSYASERRRLLVPPPFIRARGPLVPHITSLTLTSIPETAPGPTITSQTHRLDSPLSNVSSPAPVIQINPATGLPPIGVGYTAHSPSTAPTHSRQPPRLTPRRIKKLANIEAQQRMKELASRSGFAETLPHERKSQAQKDREALRDGLTFAGMWCTSDTARGASKSTAFRLELEVYTDERRNEAELEREGQDGKVLNENQFGDMQGIELSETEASASIATVDLQPSTRTPATDKPWLKLTSSPVTILSKSAIKTYKARSLVGTLDLGMPFALCVRIHAQTVRTRYVRTGNSGSQTCLTSRTGKWDPYHFDVIQLPFATGMTREEYDKLSGKLLYGSIGRIRDVYTGAISQPMKLVKTDMNEAVVGGTESGDGDPVAHLQKVAFVKVVRVDPALMGGREEWREMIDGATGGRLYLAAPGARAGGGELRHDTSEGHRKKRKYPLKKQEQAGEVAGVDRGASQADSSSIDPAFGDMDGSAHDTRGHPTTESGSAAIFDEGIDSVMPETLADTLMQVPPIGAAFRDESHGVDKALGLDVNNSSAHLLSYVTEPSSSVNASGEPYAAPASAPAESDSPKRDIKRKTRRGDLAQAVVAEGQSDETVQLTWEAATFSRIGSKESGRGLGPRGSKADKDSKENKENKEVRLEGVADWMTFTLCGVGAFSTSYEATSDSTSEHSDSLYRPTAVLQALSRPLLRPIYDHNRIALQVIVNQDAFVLPERSVDAAHDSPLPIPQVFLGTLGPLECKVMRSTSQVTDSVQSLAEHETYADPHGIDPTHPALSASSSFPSKIPHLLLYVSLPDTDVIQKAMEDLAKAADHPSGSITDINATTRSVQDPREPLQLPHPDSLQAQEAQAEFDAQLAGLDNDLGFGQSLDVDEPSWIAEYTSAVQGMQGEMNDTEAIRLALESVQDEARAAEMGATDTGMMGPAFTAHTLSGESSRDVLADSEAEAMHTQAQQDTITERVQEQGSPSVQMAIGGDMGQTNRAAHGGPVLLSPPDTSRALGQKRVSLPITIVRSGAGVEETLFYTGFGVDLDSSDVLRVVNV